MKRRSFLRDLFSAIGSVALLGAQVRFDVEDVETELEAEPVAMMWLAC